MTTLGILAAIYPQERGTFMANGFAGHWILSDRYQFHLHHHILSVGGYRYRVSTNGAYFRNDSDAAYSPISMGSKFETMVFMENSDGQMDGYEIRTIRSDDSLAATRAHYALVEEFTK